MNARKHPVTAALAIAVAVIALVFGVAAVVPDTASTPEPATTAAAQVAEPYFVSGALKPNGTGGWYVLDDAAHTPEGGLTVTSVTSTAINVSFDEGSEIYTFVVGVDETLAALGWSAGASVALDHAVIQLGRSTGIINPTQVSNVYANLWVIARLAPVIESAPNQACVAK